MVQIKDNFNDKLVDINNRFYLALKLFYLFILKLYELIYIKIQKGLITIIFFT